MSARDVIAGLLPVMWDQKAAADTILSALSAAGWVVVPREPTEAMVQAATRGVWGDCWNELDDAAQAEAMVDCAAHFRAMIAAALPAAPEARDDGR